MRSRGFGSRILLAVAGVTAGLALAELGLARLWPQPDVHLHELRADGLFFARPDFDSLFSPGSLGQAAQVRRLFGSLVPWRDMLSILRPKDPSRVITNEEGLRERAPVPVAKRPGTRRLLGIGQCAAFGLGAEQEAGYLRLLERKVAGLEVVNCALSGGSVPEAIAAYDGLCSKFEADVVLLPLYLENPEYLLFNGQLFGPDVRLLSYAYRELGDRLAGLLARDADGVPHLAPEHEAEWRERARRYFEPRLPLYRHSHLVRFLENRWSGFTPQPFPQARMATFLKQLWGRDTKDDLALLGLELDFKRLQALRERIAAKGGRLVLMIYPSSPWRAPDEMPTRADQALERHIARLFEERFEVLDLRQTGLARTWRDIGYADRAGMRPDGHQVVADELAAYLQKHLK